MKRLFDAIVALANAYALYFLAGASLRLSITKEHIDMATIKQRLALLEAAELARVPAPTVERFEALAARVDAIAADIGSDPEPASPPVADQGA